MDRNIVQEEILHLRQSKPILWKDIRRNIDIQDDDEIYASYVEAYYSENESHDGYYSAVVYRYRPETDEEVQKRLAKAAEFKEDLRKRRYATYLKLRAEFENGENNTGANN